MRLMEKWDKLTEKQKSWVFAIVAVLYGLAIMVVNLIFSLKGIGRI